MKNQRVHVTAERMRGRRKVEIVENGDIGCG
jgi:hypothetical protein